MKKKTKQTTTSSKEQNGTKKMVKSMFVLDYFYAAFCIINLFIISRECVVHVLNCCSNWIGENEKRKTFLTKLHIKSKPTCEHEFGFISHCQCVFIWIVFPMNRFFGLLELYILWFDSIRKFSILCKDFGRTVFHSHPFNSVSFSFSLYLFTLKSHMVHKKCT